MSKEKKEKKERHGLVRVSKNLLFMVKYVLKYKPSYILVTLIEAFGRGTDHITSVLFVKFLFDAIEAGLDFQLILFWSLMLGAYRAAFELFNKWRLHVYVPRAHLALHEGVQKELYQKARELDQSCYDDPEFYNDFIWAIRESDERVGTIMENFSIFINRVVSSAVILGVLASIDLVVTAVLLASLALSFLVQSKLNALRIRQKEELNPIDRKLSYVERVFYLQDYAKELRQGGIARRLQEEYQRASGEKTACLKKYMGRMFGFSLLDDFLNGILPSVGVTGYLIVRYILDPTLTLGSFSASITATFKLYWTLNDIVRHLSVFHEHSLYIERMKKFLGYAPKITGEVREIPAFESLSIRNLDFAYPFAKDGEKVLQGVSLDIKKGEKIAFVGYNGAGKTTLTKLLMRLYDSANGEILYNG